MPRTMRSQNTRRTGRRPPRRPSGKKFMKKNANPARPKSSYRTFDSFGKREQLGFSMDFPPKNSITYRQDIRFLNPTNVTDNNVNALAAPLYFEASTFNMLNTLIFPNPNPTLLNYKFFRVEEVRLHIKCHHVSTEGLMQNVPCTFLVDEANFTGVQSIGNNFGALDPQKVLQLTCNNIKDYPINTQTSKTGDFYFKYRPKSRYNQWINTGALATLIGTQNQSFAFANLINFQENNSQAPFVPGLPTSAQFYKNFHVLIAPHETFITINNGNAIKLGPSINIEARVHVRIRLHMQDQMTPLVNPATVLNKDQEEEENGFEIVPQQTAANQIIRKQQLF